MLVKDVVEIMEKHFPLSLQEAWDCSGFQLGDLNKEVHKIMISLDADNRTLYEAIEKGCDMIISHHPFLFSKISLDFSTPTGSFIKKAIDHNVAVYSSHTPLDKVAMNNWLAAELGLENIENCEEDELVKKGNLSTPLPQDLFLEKVKKVYGLDVLKFAGDKDEIINVAVCGGSGSDYIDVLKNQVDAFVTGDLKYHAGQTAYDDDILLVDIGHHAEVIMVRKLADLLESEMSVEIITSDSPDYYGFV